MPRPGPRRKLVGFKASDELIQLADERAKAEGLLSERGEPNRSELIRIGLIYALDHMPVGWRPDPERNPR